MNYELKLNRRARSIRITVRSDGSVLVSAPRYAGMARIQRFVLEKQDWILEKQKQFEAIPRARKLSLNEIRELKRKAKAMLQDRLSYYSKIYGVRYKKVTVRSQRTRWGSCSRQGNLNFNYKIALLTPELADYIVVHELCHIKEFNHSKNFWTLVAQTIPDYKLKKLELRRLRPN